MILSIQSLYGLVILANKVFGEVGLNISDPDILVNSGFNGDLCCFITLSLQSGNLVPTEQFFCKLLLNSQLFCETCSIFACFMENHISLVPQLYNITSTQISIFTGVFIIQDFCVKSLWNYKIKTRL